MSCKSAMRSGAGGVSHVFARRKVEHQLGMKTACCHLTAGVCLRAAGRASAGGAGLGAAEAVAA